MGCLPTKTLLRSAKLLSLFRRSEEFGIRSTGVEFDFQAAMARSDALIERFIRKGATPFEEQGVRYYHDHATFLSAHELRVGDEVIESDQFIIATGQVPAIPSVPGLAAAGYITNDQATHLRQLPRSLVILGGGPIGVEFAQIFSAFGCRVTLVEMAPQILPREDTEVADLMAGYLEAREVQVYTAARAAAVRQSAGTKVIAIETAEGRQEITADQILVATGRKPNIQGLELATAGVAHDRKGIQVDDTLRTSTPHIWGAGDVLGKWLFTHVAAYDGHLAGHNAVSSSVRRADYRLVPRVTFTDPEVASIGMTEQAAVEAGIPVHVSRFPFRDLPRAVIDGEAEGLVKLIAVEGTGEIIGGHIVGPDAGSLIHEIVIAMAGPLPADVVRHTLHAFPTYSEAVRWAAGGLPVEESVRVGCVLCSGREVRENSRPLLDSRKE